jgi:hypothetical protein
MGMRAVAPEVGVAIIDWSPGTLLKVLLVQVASAPAFTIQGHRCSDGHPLRFSYRGLPPVTASADGLRTPIPSIVMETEGEAVVPFDAYENTTPGSHFFTGYMLFTSAGDWLIEARDMDNKVLGTAVLRLRPAMVSASPASTASPASEIRSCGQVTAYAADGARMHLTLATGSVARQFSLEYQFAKGPYPTDMGNRLNSGQTQFVEVVGRAVEADPGSPNATVLHDFTVTRLAACP